MAFGYEPEWADVTMQQVIAWRAMHSQGRGLFSLLLRHLPDIDTRTVREGEFVCNSLVGFNFGDGHLHNHDLIKAVQAQARFEPGELIVVCVLRGPAELRAGCGAVRLYAVGDGQPGPRVPGWEAAAVRRPAQARPAGG